MTVPFCQEHDLIQVKWPTFVDSQDAMRTLTDQNYKNHLVTIAREDLEDFSIPSILNDLPAQDDSPNPEHEKSPNLQESINKHIINVVSMELVQGTDQPGHPMPQYQPQRRKDDLYTPQWTRGEGAEREGRCAFCTPPVWLRLKQSAYWYHLNYVHGISATTGRPYPMPTAYRLLEEERTSTLKLEGWCGQCQEWRPVGSRQLQEDDADGDYFLLRMSNSHRNLLSERDYKEMFPHTNWFKHCQKMHKSANDIH